MFNLIMLSTWQPETAMIEKSRLFEHTEERVVHRFSQDQGLLYDELMRLPCLFMLEGKSDQVARVGYVSRVRESGRHIHFHYSIDETVPPLSNEHIFANRMALDMPNEFEFSRNHWAVKDQDLYQFLLRNAQTVRQFPTAFSIPRHEQIDPTLASAMMPFGANFDSVYEAIKNASASASLTCRRADDIWEHQSIIQDVVSLIDRSRIVICDLTGKNPNVFYEAGVAHTLGRDVILITQSGDDVPFDLSHIRHIRYLNNAQGLAELTQQLAERIQTLIGH